MNPGTRLGHYEILDAIGKGAMGEVWRARDTNLGRDVAIKTLPPQFAEDADRLARFEREARLLALLNHPNIAAIYDLEVHEGRRFLVLELVDGDTLADRLTHGPMPLDECLTVASQIVEALEAAHERGVVHRDLKPANVKTTPEGVVKVLDFGLAKAVDEPSHDFVALSQSPTVLRGTVAGLILGTPGYLSPEQARGKPVDKRTDIWAFGCVLYEMLTGRRAFAGETVSDVLAATLTRDPDMNGMERVPERLQELLGRCLQKDPLRRLRDIGDARILLEEIRLAPASPPAAVRAAGIRARIPAWAWPLGVCLAFLAGLGVMWLRTDGRMALPRYAPTKMGGPEVAMSPRVSPEGNLVAFAAMVDGLTQVGVMQAGSGEWDILTSNRADGYVEACGLSWSSTGVIYYDRWYGVPRGVFSIPSIAGRDTPETLVVPDAACPEVLPDDSLLVLQVNDNGQFQIYRHWPGTDRPRQAYPLVNGSGDWGSARVFRDGTRAAFWGVWTSQSESDSCQHLHLLDLESGAVSVVETDAVLPCTSFDLNLAIGADDETILASIQRGNGFAIVEIPVGGGPSRELVLVTDRPFAFDVAPNGDLYVGADSRPLELLSIEPDGAHARTMLITEAFVNIPGTVLPDGRVLFTSEAGGRRRVLAVGPGRDPLPLLPQIAEETSGPVAAVGDADVAFLVGPEATRQLVIASMDGRSMRRLSRADGRQITSLAASPDGTTLYYSAAGRIWAIDALEGEPRARRDGDSVTVDPRDGSLIVQLIEQATVRLVRVPANGGPEQVLSFPDVRLAPMPLTPAAVRSDGAIVKNISAPDYWPWLPVVLHPDTGRVQRIPLPSFLDAHHVSWTPRGSVIVFGLQTRSSIWRFSPVQAP